jgi:hypothetical protein
MRSHINITDFEFPAKVFLAAKAYGFDNDALNQAVLSDDV